MAGGFTAAVIQYGAKAHAAGRPRRRGPAAVPGTGLPAPRRHAGALVARAPRRRRVTAGARRGRRLRGRPAGRARRHGGLPHDREQDDSGAQDRARDQSRDAGRRDRRRYCSSRNPTRCGRPGSSSPGSGMLLCLIPISAAYRRAVLQPALPLGCRRVSGGSRCPWGWPVSSAAWSLRAARSSSSTGSPRPTAVGVFALAYGLATHVFAPAQAFVGPLVPAISGLREVDPSAVPAAFRRVHARRARPSSASSSPSASCRSRVLVPVLYGAEFASAAPLFVALSPRRRPRPGRRARRGLRLGPAVGRCSCCAPASWPSRVDVGLAVVLVPGSGVGRRHRQRHGALLSLALLGRTEIRLLGLPRRLLLRARPRIWWGQAIALRSALAASGLGGNAWVRAVCAGLAGLLLYVAGLRLLRSA